MLLLTHTKSHVTPLFSSIVTPHLPFLLHPLSSILVIPFHFPVVLFTLLTVFLTSHPSFSLLSVLLIAFSSFYSSLSAFLRYPKSSLPPDIISSHTPLNPTFLNFLRISITGHHSSIALFLSSLLLSLPPLFSLSFSSLFLHSLFPLSFSLSLSYPRFLFSVALSHALLPAILFFSLYCPLLSLSRHPFFLFPLFFSFSAFSIHLSLLSLPHTLL